VTCEDDWFSTDSQYRVFLENDYRQEKYMKELEDRYLSVASMTNISKIRRAYPAGRLSNNVIEGP